MEFAVHSPRSLGKQCKLSDYVTTATAAIFEGGDSVEQTKTSTPVTPKNQKEDIPNTPKINPVMARIQRDLNSPSANLRMRALKAIKSPTRSEYGQFDVSHNEKSIITADERAAALQTPPSLREILKDIIVYVEVRTADDDRSAGVKKVIEALGARVNDNLRRDTTHVIFKDGRQSTFKRAKCLNIPIVSILWIEACKNQRRICDPKDFPISNLDRYENPELYGKMKRYKFIQPGAEDKKRRPKKAITPTPPEADKTNYSQTEIGRFFKALDKSATATPNSVVKTPAKSNKIIDSPATALLKRITSNNYTPIASINKCKSGPKNAIETTPLNSRQKSKIETNIDDTTVSIAQMFISQQTPESIQTNHNKNGTQSARKMNAQRRQSMLPIANSTRFSDLNQTQNKTPQNNEIIVTEELIVEDNNSSNLFTVRSTVRRRTSITCQPMEITEKIKITPNNESQQKIIQQRRRTLYTPETMLEATKEEEVKQQKTATETPNLTSNEDTIIDAESMAITPKMQEMEQIESAPISASRHLCRRRTIFDLSMDIISHQVQNLNTKSRKSILNTQQQFDVMPAVAPKTVIETETDVNDCNTPNENASKKVTNNKTKVQSNEKEETEKPTIPPPPPPLVEKKKRKLFQPTEASQFTPPPPPTPKSQQSQLSRKSLSLSVTPKAATKRRRTLMPSQSTNSVANSIEMPNQQTKSAAVFPQTLPNKKNLHSRRSSMDFEVEKCSKLKTKSKSVTSLKENKLTSLNPKRETVAKKLIVTTTAAAAAGGTAKRRLPFLAFTNMHTEQIATIDEIVKKLGGFTLERTVCSNTTHMVSLEPRRTMNLLRGLVRGLWILEYNWILDSSKAGHWLNEEQYELKDFSRAVEICRAERQAFGSHYKCELFADLGAFFISPRCDNIPTRDLKELIRLCGGKIVEQRQNAKYILSSSTRAVDDKIYVTPLWILDSITQMQLLRIQKYTASTQLPTKHTPGNTRNMPTAVEL